MATVKIDHVDKLFGSVQVLQEVNLDIADGEFIVLVGPSGCGKSTILRIVSGLEQPTHGTISIGDRDVTDVAPKDRDIAMVFQSYALYPHISVRDNLSFALTIRATEPHEIEERVANASEILGLTDLLDRLPKQLSGGQRQRVAMGRAIVRNPQVFLFDEPLSNLDAKLRIQMRKEIKELHQRLKSTAIYVTHDQIEAMTMADRVVVMKSGFIAQVGTPLHLYDKPANKFVAGFIGAPSMNFLEGSVVETDGGLKFSVDDVLLPLPDVHSADPGANATLGIRPEHLEIVDAGGDANFTVAVVEPTGSETLIECAHGQHRLQVMVKDRVEFSPGDKIELKFDPQRVHLFETASEQRL